MTSLMDRTGLGRLGLSGRSSDPVPLAPSTGMTAGLQAAAVSGVVFLAPVVLAWVSAAGGQSSMFDALRTGGVLWLLAHRVASKVAGGSISIVPLAAMAIPIVTCAVTGARMARTLDPEPSNGRRHDPSPAPRSAIGAMALTYAAIAAIVASLSVSKDFTPVWWQAPLFAGVLAAASSWLGSQSHARGGWRALIDLGYDMLPGSAERFVAPVLVAVGVQLAFGAVVLVIAVVMGFSRIGDLYAALHGGLIGALMITVLQLLLLPNLLIWAAAWLTGPGFTMGTGSTVSLAESTLGPLPALPIFGALPDPGPMPGWAMAGVLAGVIAGVVAGQRLIEETDRWDDERSWTETIAAPVLDICGLTLGATVVFGLLGLISGGAMGPGRLSHVGPVWGMLPAFALEVAIGAGLAYLVRLVAPAAADAWAERR